MSDGPLTQQNYRELNAALAAVNKARIAIESARRAGVNVDEHAAALEYVEQRLNQIKGEYFKGQR